MGGPLHRFFAVSQLCVGVVNVVRRFKKRFKARATHRMTIEARQDHSDEAAGRRSRRAGRCDDNGVLERASTEVLAARGEQSPALGHRSGAEHTKHTAHCVTRRRQRRQRRQRMDAPSSSSGGVRRRARRLQQRRASALPRMGRLRHFVSRSQCARTKQAPRRGRRTAESSRNGGGAAHYHWSEPLRDVRDDRRGKGGR